MNEGVSDIAVPRWSRARWTVVVLLLAAVQAGMVLGLTRWPRLADPTSTGDRSSRLDILDQGVLPRGLMEEDPRQFARPDPQGFSGAAARAMPPPDYTLAEWPGRPRWLGAEAQPNRQGTAPPPAPPPEVRSRAVPPVALSHDTRAPLLLPTNTVVYPRGDLAGHTLQATAPPLVLPGIEVLSPTVVEVGVAPSGHVVVARVTGLSGNPEADQLAFTWAQGVRFPDLARGADDEVQPGPLTWGELAIVWRVQPSVR